MNKNKKAFTLIEILIYTVLIGVAGVFFNETLVSVLKLQGQQYASTEVNQQINFVLQNIQRSVRESSLIDMPSDMASSTLTLRMADPVVDPTLIYLSGSTIYVKKGTAEPNMLTTTDANADLLEFTKVSAYPGHDSVSVNLSLSYNTQNAQKGFSKTISSAVSRVNAATFDSDILPGIDAAYSVGTVPNRWQDLNLSRNLTVGGMGIFTGNVGIGTANPTEKLEIGGTAGVDGIKFPDGTVQKTAATAGGGGGGIPTVEILASGTYLIPTGVTKILVEVWGGGGAGGTAGGNSNSGGGGGGAGGYAKQILTVTPGDSYTVTVGAAGGVSSFIGTAGTVSANGGSAGAAATANGGGLGGNGGSATGAITITGGSGGGGSGGAASPAIGGSGGQGGSAGNGGGGGGGGNGLGFGGNTGKAGSVPGGGGGGGGGWSFNAGGAGAAGRVLVSY